MYRFHIRLKKIKPNSVLVGSKTEVFIEPDVQWTSHKELDQESKKPVFKMILLVYFGGQRTPNALF